MKMPVPVRVIGCGSPLGDDAVAWQVIDRLRGSDRLPGGVELSVVEGGHQLLDLLDGCETLVLVDAVISGSEPGRVHRFEWPDGRVKTLRPGTTHDMRPAEALELAGTLGMMPARVLVFGVEVASVSAASGMSESVAEAVPQVVNRILEELRDARNVTATRIDQAS